MKSLGATSPADQKARAGAKRLTSADYAALPEGPPYYELIDGKLFSAFESPIVPHQRICGKLYFALAAWAERSSAGEVLFAPMSVYLSRYDVLLPDLIFIARHRIPELVRDRIHGSPDLVVEILSPSTASIDRNRKPSRYARAGVRELWIVDPKLARIEIHRLEKAGGGPPVCFGVGSVLTTPLLPGLEIEVAGILEHRPD